MLKIQNLTKRFNGQTALNSVSLSVKPGEIHGLVGLNGSGKSTLLNILFGAGVIAKTGGYNGSIKLNDRPCRFISPQQAITGGVGMVHQEFALIPRTTVAANIYLTRENSFRSFEHLIPAKYSLVNWRTTTLRAKNVLRSIGIDLDATQIVDQLPLSLKQFTEIAREISRDNLKLLLLDEPTAVLNRSESNSLQRALTKIAAKGTSILFVSHRIGEIETFCERFSVLRDGNLMGTFTNNSKNLRRIPKLISHVHVAKVLAQTRKIASSPILSTKNFSVALEGDKLCKLNLDIYEGEIFGITCLSGHGKSGLGYGVTGLRHHQGEMYFNGKKIDSPSPASTIAAGIYLLPEERGRSGLLLDRSITENIVFTAYHQKKCFLRTGLPGLLHFPDKKEMNRHASNLIDMLDIRCSSPRQKVGELSGGNQQKVCIAQALTLSPRLLFVNEPTRGIDITAKEKILQHLLTANRTRGMTLVISSSELEELQRICDRIAVLVEGKLRAILSPQETEDTFFRLMTGEEPVYQ